MQGVLIALATHLMMGRCVVLPILQEETSAMGSISPSQGEENPITSLSFRSFFSTTTGLGTFSSPSTPLSGISQEAPTDVQHISSTSPSTPIDTTSISSPTISDHTSSESVTSIFCESSMSSVTSISPPSGDNSDKDSTSVMQTKSNVGESITNTAVLSSGTAAESPISTSREVENKKHRETTTLTSGTTTTSRSSSTIPDAEVAVPTRVRDADTNGDGRNNTEDGEDTAASGRTHTMASSSLASAEITSLSMTSASHTASHHAQIMKPTSHVYLCASTESQTRLPSDIVMPTAIASNTGTTSSMSSKISAGNIAGLTLGTTLALAVISGLLAYFLWIKGCLRRRMVRACSWEMVNSKEVAIGRDGGSDTKTLSPSSVSLKDSQRGSAASNLTVTTESSKHLSQRLSLAERRGVSRPQALNIQRRDSVDSNSVNGTPFEGDVWTEQEKISPGPPAPYNSIIRQGSNPLKPGKYFPTTKGVGQIPGGSRALYHGSALQAEMQRNVIPQCNYRVEIVTPPSIKEQDEGNFELEPDEDILFGVAF